MKRKTVLIIFLKIIILLASLAFIYFQFQKQKSHISTDNIPWKSIFSNNVKLWILVLLLMPISWLLEAMKWKILLLHIEKISLFTSLKAIFAGLFVGIFTPNRIGEFGGRILFLKKGHRIFGGIATYVGSLPQIIITISIGIISFFFFLNNKISINQLPNYLILYVSILLILILMFIYFNLNLLSTYFLRFRWTKKWAKYARIFKYYHFKELLPVFLLSFTRYMVFTFQLFLLLKIYVDEISYLQTFPLIAMVYFAQTVIPSFVFADLGIRGAVSTYFIGLATNNITGILLASFSLWFINIILPSIIGLIFILRLKFFGNRTSVF